VPFWIEGYHAIAYLLVPRVGGPLTTWENVPSPKSAMWAWVDYFFNPDKIMKVRPADTD
jgi:hypothetical protein